MKKMFVLLIMLCLVPALTVSATPPIMPGTFDVIIESCEGNEELHFDLLVNPTDYWGEDFQYVADQIRYDYKDKFPNYQSFDFLVEGEYISYRAYIDSIFNYMPVPCRFHLETMIADHASFDFLVFLEDGTVVYQETFQMDDLGYKDGYRYYTSLVYDVDENTANLDTNRVRSIADIILMVLFGGALFLIILISIPIIIIVRRRN